MPTSPLGEPWESIAERTVLAFVQGRLAMMGEARGNWKMEGSADPQIEANLFVAESLLAAFTANPSEAIFDEAATLSASLDAIAASSEPEFRHHAYLAYAEFKGYIRGVREALAAARAGS